MSKPIRLKTISDLHRFNNISSPEHPLISVIDYSKIKPTPENNELKWVQELYTISIKRNILGKYRYGQETYDFDEGLMTFFSPEQVISVQLMDENTEESPSGLILAVHPDFLFGTALATKIKKYSFLKYSVREALFLSAKEELIINEILLSIENEYQANLDRFSQQIIISKLELLLNYAERFYERQFLTRKVTNHQILDKLEVLLQDYFDNDSLVEAGLPSVQSIAQRLNLSPDYLSSMLKNFTGQTTQQFIHQKIVELAKIKLSTTTLSVSEIAYSLGFIHPQSFGKLFKNKTNLTPLEFRASFN